MHAPCQQMHSIQQRASTHTLSPPPSPLLCFTLQGQYGPNAAGSKPGYQDDATVPKGSVTPTFATAVLHINNNRWKGEWGD